MAHYSLTTAFSIAVFCLGLWIGRKPKRTALATSCVALALILAKVTLLFRPDWEAALFPWVDYVYFQSYWLYPPIFFFFGLVPPQLPVRWNRCVVYGVTFCLLSCSLWEGRWMVSPPDESSTQRADENHHCHQTTLHTCAPAACVSMLSHWGVSATEGEMARLCLTRESGTSMFNIYRGLKLKLRDSEYGVKLMKLDASKLRDLGVPAIIIAEGHSVVVRVVGGEVVVNDPLYGSPLRWDLKTYRHHLEDEVGAVISAK